MKATEGSDMKDADDLPDGNSITVEPGKGLAFMEGAVESSVLNGMVNGLESGEMKEALESLDKETYVLPDGVLDSEHCEGVMVDGVEPGEGLAFDTGMKEATVSLDKEKEPGKGGRRQRRRLRQQRPPDVDGQPDAVALKESTVLVQLYPVGEELVGEVQDDMVGPQDSTFHWSPRSTADLGNLAEVNARILECMAEYSRAGGDDGRLSAVMEQIGLLEPIRRRLAAKKW